MGNFFLNAHSGLRYLILLAGVLTVLYAMYGVASGRAYDKAIRILATSFAGTIHLQILLGLALLFSGAGFQPALTGHFSMMLFAALVALALIAGGILAIRPSIFG